MPNPFGFGRHVFLKSGGHIGVPLPLTLVQYATAAGTDNGAAAILGSSPKVGNVLFVVLGGATIGIPTQTAGPTVTRIGSAQHAITTGSGAETVVNTYQRAVQSGDGSSYNFNNPGRYGIIVAEFSGLVPSGPADHVAGANDTAGTTVAVTLGGAHAEAGFLAISTRLEYQDATNLGVFTPNAASTMVAAGSNDIAHGTVGGLVFLAFTIGSIALLYGAGDATLGGGMSGVTRDAYTMGYTAFDWPRASF